MKDITRKLLKKKMQLYTLADIKEVEFNKVLEIYTRYSVRIYKKENVKEFYNDQVEDKIYDLTERWLSIYGK